MYKTVNGGTTWTAQTLPNFSYFLNDIFFVDANVGYVGGANHKLFKTTDGGTTWTLLNIPNVVTNPQHIQFFTADTGWVSENGGRIFQTVDGGVTWQNINYVGPSPGYGFHFFNSKYGYYGGSNGLNCDTKLFRTDDCGITWQNTHLPFWFDINGVYMTDTNSVYVVGDYANIIHYGDSVSTITSTSNPSPFVEEFKCEVFPMVGQITIKSNFKISTICIKDISGRTVYTKTCNTKELIANVSFLSSNT